MSATESASGPHHFVSTRTAPESRGEEFGEANRGKIAATVGHYLDLFGGTVGIRPNKLDELAAEALAAIDGWAPGVGREIRGIAAGANQPLHHVAAINARTEILAHGNANVRGECSTVVHLGTAADRYPEAQQNWDWYSSFSDDWLVWAMQLEDGRRIETLTEYGVVAKAGCNSAGVGVLFNILHHADDGQRIGVPVHVVARRLLESAEDAASALTIIASASLSASTTMTVVSGGDAGKVAVSVETSPHDLGYVFPDGAGVLVHTNHFLSDPLCRGDLEHRRYPDTVLRYDALQRSMRHHAKDAPRSAISRALSSTVGGALAVCCRPDPRQKPEFQFASLAHVRLDLENTRVVVHRGGPDAST